MKTIFGILVSLSLISYIICADAYIINVFWEWFISPFFNFRLMHFKEALGFAIVLKIIQDPQKTILLVLTRESLFKSFPDTDNNLKLMGLNLVMPFIYLLIGWIIKIYING